MQRTGFKFNTMSPDIDEKAIRHPDPKMLTMTLALAKAECLVRRIRRQFGDDFACHLITCDQVAVFGGAIREKPESADEARAWLMSYRGSSVETVTSVTVTTLPSGPPRIGTDHARVFFRDITDDAIEAIIARGDVMGSCGAFVLDDPELAPCVDRIEGFKDSIDGLPLLLTLELLAKAGHRP
jgi:septum formation protein